MTGLYLQSGKNMLLSALLLMLFQCAFAANYADAEKQVRMWIGTKHIDNRKMLEICIKKVDDISSLQLPEMQKIEELKKSFAPAFSELKKAQSEVITELFRQAYLKHEYKAQGIIGCCFYFGIGGIGLPITNVFFDGIGKQKYILLHNPYTLTQRFLC